MAETGPEKRRDVIRETDDEAVRLAKTLLRTAQHGALAVIDPESGGPLASRVGVATDLDGTPLILISMLSSHTPALLADPRCSLLLGTPGKGDPLAHPRLSLVCRAERLERGTPGEEQARRRYLNRNPKAQLYAGLGDFRFFRLAIERASLNGGFGRAYILEAADIIAPVPEGFAQIEQGAIDHMNIDHPQTVELYATHYAKLAGGDWRMTGIDAEGFDLADGDAVARVWFPQHLTEPSKISYTLVQIAASARKNLT